METKLKLTEVRRYEVSAYNFEAFIKEIYGQSFEIYCDQEHSNEVMSISVSKTRELKYENGEVYKDADDKAVWLDTHVLSAYDQKDLDAWIATGKGSFVFRNILDDLANKNLIPTGNYLIDGTW
jgi:hypothetical protein